MSAIEKLKNPPKRDNRCGTSAWLAAQSEETHLAVIDALANGDWKSTDLHKLLVDEWNYPLGYNQFTRHRNGVCCG